MEFSIHAATVTTVVPAITHAVFMAVIMARSSRMLPECALFDRRFFLCPVCCWKYCSLETGPRDDEFAGQRFSFVRYSSICAVIPNSEAFEDAARSAGAMQAEIDKATAASGGSGLLF